MRAAWRLLLHAGLTLVLLIVFEIAFILASPGGIRQQLDAMGTAELGSPLLLIPAVVAVTLATWLARRLFDRRSFWSLGLRSDRHTAADLAVGTLMPGLLFGLIYAFEWAAGWLEFQAWAWETLTAGDVLRELVLVLMAFVLVGYWEELVARGYHLQNLHDALGLFWALLISSAIFSLLHFSNPGATWQSALGILAAGYFLGFAWLRTGKLWLPIGLHIGWNFFQGPIFGFPVSGIGGFRLIRQEVNGPELLTGGAFGPEAGLTGLAAMLVGASLIAVYTRGRSPDLSSKPPDSKLED